MQHVPNTTPLSPVEGSCAQVNRQCRPRTIGFGGRQLLGFPGVALGVCGTIVWVSLPACVLPCVSKVICLIGVL